MRRENVHMFSYKSFRLPLGSLRSSLFVTVLAAIIFSSVLISLFDGAACVLAFAK
jgi:hypothetical protein